MAARGVCTSNRSGTASAQTTVTLTFPVGAFSVGDRFVGTTDTNASSVTVTAASGANTWTATAGPTPVAAALSGYLFERVLDATDVATGSVTFTWSASGRVQAMGEIWPPGDTATPFAFAAATTVTGNSLVLPAYTTQTPSADVAILVDQRIAIGITAPQVTLPGTFTRDGDVGTNVASNVNTEAAIGHLTTPVATGTSVGGGTTTSGTNATHIIGWIVELRAQFTGTAALSGSGTLTASGSPIPSGAAALSGSGTLTASGVPIFNGAAALSGSGTLTTAGTPAPNGAATLSGSGTLAATGVPTFNGAANLTGSGTLAATGSPVINGAASLSGSGSLSAQGIAILAGLAAFTSEGTLTAVGAVSRDITVTLGQPYGRAITTGDVRGRQITTGTPHGRSFTVDPVRSDP